MEGWIYEYGDFALQIITDTQLNISQCRLFLVSFFVARGGQENALDVYLLGL